MENLVRAFNALPRPRTTPSGLPNHWIFRIRHVPLQPPGDLLIAIHPQSTYQLTAGPAQVLHLPTGDRAEAIVKMLLELFIKGHRGPSGEPDLAAPPPWAPWSWATEDAELAIAIEEALRRHAVMAALCHVGICTAEEKEVMGEAWSGLVGMLMKMMGLDAKSRKARAATASSSQSAAQDSSDPAPVELGDDSRCHHCCKALTGARKKCSACGKAYYCDRDCQKGDWKRHKKPGCLSNRSRASGSMPPPTSMDASTYLNTIACNDPEAQSLARSLNLALTGNDGTKKPLRRLMVTGKDSPENIQLLFGPNWKTSMQALYDETRIEVLLNPPHGSPSYTVNANLDNGGPSWAPRPASEEELGRVAEVREMQTKIRQRVGSGRSPTGEDMQAILTAFGGGWAEKLPLYQLAVNTMDQGVQMR